MILSRDVVIMSLTERRQEQERTVKWILFNSKF